MPVLRAARILAFCLALTVLWPFCSPAQSPVDPGQLPGRTSFYMFWHGTPSGEVRAKNSLLALWDDPDFAPARSALVASLLTQNKNQKDKPAISREEAAQYVTLLDNPFLLGYFSQPEHNKSAATAKTGSATTKPGWNGIFFIYDRTGKEDLVSKAVLRFRGSETDIPKLTNLTIAGVSSLKVEHKSGVTYWAEFGKYAVSAQELQVFEEILNLLNGKPAANPLSHSAAFTEAKPLLAGGVIEFFVNLANLKDLALDNQGAVPASPATQFKPLLSGLKLDALHSISGKLSLEGPKTRFQAAILGEPAPGGIFDVFADGQSRPASLAFVSPDTLYYSESQIDLLSLYKVLKRAFTQASDNPAQVNLLDAMAGTRLGMPLENALGVTTGEFASLQTSPTLDNSQQLYFLGIANKADALKLTRSLMGDRIASERNEGNTTYLKISLQGGQSKAGVAGWNFYYLAMTPSTLLGAQKSETLHKYLEQASGDPVPPKALQSMRSQFPEKLNGLTFVDFQKLDWAALKAKWIAEAERAAKNTKSTDAAKSSADVTTWLTQVNPDVIPRHLHSIAGASWKNATGVHWDEWLE